MTKHEHKVTPENKRQPNKITKIETLEIRDAFFWANERAYEKLSYFREVANRFYQHQPK